MGLELEIVDTSEENLLKSLDADLYDCVISGVGLSQWNETHYSHTMPYADISSVQERQDGIVKYTELSIFYQKKGGNPMAGEFGKESAGTLEGRDFRRFHRNILKRILH